LERKKKNTAHSSSNAPISLLFPPEEMRKKMPVGFVLVRVSPKHESEVFNNLSKLSEVVELHQLFGEYDLLAKVESVGYEHIGEIVVNKIRTIDGITDTQTLAAINY
jgi:DNA-binding Lrp family transcriptional regulator